jgi:hypothetical protein
MRHYYNTATAFSYDESSTYTEISVGTKTSHTSTAVPIVLPQGLAWEDAIYGGLRFKVAPDKAQILAGHSATEPRSEPEVIDTFLDFATQYWSVTDLRYSLFSQPWPRVRGWVDTSEGETITIEVMGEDPQRGGTRTYWPGATFTEPSPLPKGYSRPAPERTDDRLFRELKKMFDAARDEVFDYGTPSEFAIQIEAVLSPLGGQALQALMTYLFEAKGVSAEATMESLAIVGRTAIGSLAERRGFLARFLSHPSPAMRDAAALALVDLGDADGAAALLAAAARETHPQLRSNLLEAAEQLAE